MPDYSYIGVGQVYLRDINGSGGLLPIGNVSLLDFSAQEETKELMDYTTAGGGTRNEVRRVKGVEAKIKLHDLDPANLSLALYGDATAVAASTATDEAITAKLGALIPLAHAAPTTVVVTNVGATVTYVAGTDYEVKTGGIFIPATGSTITDGLALLVDYAYAAQDVVEAFVNAAGEYEMVFDGVNEARSGKACVVRVHRIRFGAAANLSLIGDDYAGLELTGKLLSDTTQGAGVSKFFKTTLLQ
jgi:hypothetical protein